MGNGLEYNGILVRASLEDDGNLPRSGALQDSPDTSPQGDSEVSNPKTFFRDTYDQGVAKPIVAGQGNLVYIRGRNTGGFAQSGTAYLYWAKEADLDSPARWRNNGLFTRGGSDQVPIPRTLADQIAVATTPFAYMPPADHAGANIALLGVIATNEHPNPIPGLGDSIDFDRWISMQGGIGVLQATIAPPPRPKSRFTTTAQFNLGNTAGNVDFYIKTVGIPLGWKVSFSAAKKAPDGSPIGLAETTINSDPFTQGTFANLDAGYSSELTFNLFAGSGLPAKENYVTVYAGQLEETLGAAKKGQARVYASAKDLEGGSGGPGRFVIQAQYTTKIVVPTSR